MTWEPSPCNVWRWMVYRMTLNIRGVNKPTAKINPINQIELRIETLKNPHLSSPPLNKNKTPIFPSPFPFRTLPSPPFFPLSNNQDKKKVKVGMYVVYRFFRERELIPRILLSLASSPKHPSPRLLRGFAWDWIEDGWGRGD